MIASLVYQISYRYLKLFISYRGLKRSKSNTHAQRIHAHTSGRQLKITFLIVLDYSDTDISTFFSRKHSFLSEEAKYFKGYKLIFLELSYIFENTVSAMIRNHNHETIRSTTQKSFECKF